jgi:integrase
MRGATGIIIRHSRTCATQADKQARCNCRPSYRAEVYDRRSGVKLRKTFRNLEEAKGWRHDTAAGLRKGTVQAPTKQTLRDAAELWLDGAQNGTVRTRSGDRYKPSVIRGYEQALRDRILPELGAQRLSDVQRPDVQRIPDEMLGEGANPSTIRNTLMPLRAIYRRAIEDGDVAVNPTASLRLPAVRGRRDRIASPEEAGHLLAALPERDRPLWAVAFYSGLRLGELRALRFEDIDLAAGKIRVERSWDPQAGVVEPKSRAGRRSVPIPAVLRDYLDEHKLRTPWQEGLVFGRAVARPFNPSSVWSRALTGWRKTHADDCPRRADDAAKCGCTQGLEPIGLHEARHTYASLMIAAGVNAKALAVYMGHSSVTITYDRYGHLMPGNEDEAAALLDAYLERANTKARLAQVGE